jgi:hypothetical protein
MLGGELKTNVMPERSAETEVEDTLRTVLVKRSKVGSGCMGPLSSSVKHEEDASAEAMVDSLGKAPGMSGVLIVGSKVQRCTMLGPLRLLMNLPVTGSRGGRLEGCPLMCRAAQGNQGQNSAPG